MRKEIRRLRTWLGRVVREVQRKAPEVAGKLKHKLDLAQRLHAQQRDSKNKLYALHAPEVECIAKGKARTPYEFGVKTSLAVTAKEGVVVGMRSMPGNPYDGYTMHSQLEQVHFLTGVEPTTVIADCGYRGVQAPEGVALSLSYAKNLSEPIRKLLRRRQVT